MEPLRPDFESWMANNTGRPTGSYAAAANVPTKERRLQGMAGAAARDAMNSATKPINDYPRIMECLKRCGDILQARLDRRERILKGLPVPEEIIPEDEDE